MGIIENNAHPLFVRVIRKLVRYVSINREQCLPVVPPVCFAIIKPTETHGSVPSLKQRNEQSIPNRIELSENTRSLPRRRKGKCSAKIFAKNASADRRSIEGSRAFSVRPKRAFRKTAVFLFDRSCNRFPWRHVIFPLQDVFHQSFNAIVPAKHFQRAAGLADDDVGRSFDFHAVLPSETGVVSEKS